MAVEAQGAGFVHHDVFEGLGQRIQSRTQALESRGGELDAGHAAYPAADRGRRAM
jgi:hypothetical protein